MSAKEDLLQIRLKAKRIERINEEIERLRTVAQGLKGIDYSGVKVQTSASGSTMADQIVRIEEIQQKLTIQTARLEEERSAAIDIINQIDDWRYEEVLTKRYVDGEKWEEIAEEIEYNERWVQKLHGQALKEYDKITKRTLKDTTKCATVME